MKCRIVILFVMIPVLNYAQLADTNLIKSLYDRCLDFDEEKLDSIKFYAAYIAGESNRIGFIKGDVLSFRLFGLYHELSNEYEKAVAFYLKSLDAARKINGVEYETAALSDLSIVYSRLKRPEKAREMYKESIRLSAIRGDIDNLVTAYINLAAIYTQLSLYDSAMVLLREALRVSKPVENRMDLSSLYNNLGNVYFRMGRHDAALQFFHRNRVSHKAKSDIAGLWVDYLNIADVLIEKRQYDSARWYADNSLRFARQLRSRSKAADSYQLLADLCFLEKDYKAAYQYQKMWYELDTALVNGEINRSIATLQERFDAREREHQNFLLNAAIEKQKLRTSTIALIAVAAGIIALLVAVSLIQIRKANRKLLQVNELIRGQNKRLAELNFEKNSLISIVSHDLSTPFASIRMWGNVLLSGSDELNDEQRKAVERIVVSTQRGENLIRTILDVEKAETSRHVVHLEHFDCTTVIEAIVNDFRQAAAGKRIALHYCGRETPLYLLNDRLLLSRIFENLISNAIKFTPEGKNVYISIEDKEDAVCIPVRDEGVGMNGEDLNNLYSKYGKLSSRPTDGEASTGLGLFIVKRLVDELNGKIHCESKPGAGTTFTVIFRK